MVVTDEHFRVWSLADARLFIKINSLFYFIWSTWVFTVSTSDVLWCAWMPVSG